jgi:hypothetical protein
VAESSNAGTPRTAGGKPDLTAPARRTADGKPDLTGVWMHEITTVEEMRRLFGPMIDAAVKVDVPGMEIGTQHKYGFNVLVDVKPQDSPLRPEAAKLMQEQANRDAAVVCETIPGFLSPASSRSRSRSSRPSHDDHPA